MAQVKVMNMDHREYREVFQDEEIVIKPGGYVEMGRAAAITFLSQAIPIKIDGAGKCVRPKNLKLVEDPEAHAAHRGQPMRFTAPDGKEFATQAGYDNYLETMAEEAKTGGDKGEPKRRVRAKA